MSEAGTVDNEENQMATDGENIGTFRDSYLQVQPDSYFPYTQSLKDEKTPLIIDNGSYQCKVGWLTDESPTMIFRNLALKPKSKKTQNQEDNSLPLVGNDIGNIELLRWSLRTQFDGDVVTHYDVQEQVFDHIFSHLNISSEQCVDHPILMTEAVCNPNYSRLLMSELLFECYHVPQVIYGIDSLYSYYFNCMKKRSSLSKTALVISSGYQTTHVLPVLDGRLDAVNCKRVNVGGAYATVLMHRLLQLKYPNHASLISLSRAQELVHDHTYVAIDYADELDEWSSPSYHEENVRKIQLPFNPATALSNTNGKTDEKEKLRRQKQGQRLQELNARRRDKKLVAEEEKLQRLLNIRELEDQESQFWDALEEADINSIEDLNAEIDRLRDSIVKRRDKATSRNSSSGSKRAASAPVYDLLDIPDEELTQEQIERKKRQRMLKNASIGREKAKRERDERKAQKEAQEKEEERKREENFDGWLEGIRQQREEILSQRQQRRALKQNMASRRSHAAQERMRIITQLADDTGAPSGKGVKGNKVVEDTFGQNDEDWMVYKAINLDSNSDSEREEARLTELESLLKQYDESFKTEVQSNSSDPKDIATRYQLHLGVERIRAPEILFQPSIRGVEQAGLHHTMAFVLKHYSDDVQNLLVQNVFVTGGNTNYPRLQTRLEKELLCMRPFKSTFKVDFAENYLLDAWKGARQWLLDQTDLQSVSISRLDYEEKGGEYLKEHFASNRYIPSPKAD